MTKLSEKAVLEYLEGLGLDEPRRRRDAAAGALDRVFEFLNTKEQPGQRDLFLAMNLLRPIPKPDGEIFRTMPLPKALEDEAHAAVARILWEAAHELFCRDPKGTLSLTYILRALACCFDPKSKVRRQARVRNRGKDYETDDARDQSIASLVHKLRKTKGGKRAISEAAALIRRSPKAVREARKRVAQRHRKTRKAGLGKILRLHKIF